MASDDHTPNGGQDRATSSRSRLFAVRLWTEEVADGCEYRGSVREVVSGAFRNFRDWSDLTSFLTERMQEDSRAQTEQLAEGELEWPRSKR